MNPSEYPRALTDLERETLEFVLSVDDARVAPLRNQAKSATVVRGCTCGCATVDLQVDRSLGSPSALGSPAITAITHGMLDGAAEPSNAYELLVFLHEGWLASLEVAYYGDTPPPTFPSASTFEAPEINWWAQRDEAVEGVRAWFGARGFKLDIWRHNREFVARLSKSSGKTVTADYARGSTALEAAERARERMAAQGPTGSIWDRWIRKVSNRMRDNS